MNTHTPSRTFLFLQGPQSRFFRRLGHALAACGARVIKINFCGGDVFHWNDRYSRSYRGSALEWSSWVARIMREEQVTDLLLFGDWRPLHREAILLSRLFDITVHVFEEGYLRPDYITMEEGGVNGHSSMPATTEALLREADLLTDAPPPVSVPNPLPVRVYDAIWHHVGNFLLWSVFFRYQTHRPTWIGRELLGLLPRYLTRRKRVRRSEEYMTAFLSAGPRYFFFPLQLDTDAQVRRFSPFAGMCEGICFVLSSFARHAPGDVHLLIKNHPLDNGLISYRRFIADYARACGVADRVHFVEEGNGMPMIKSAAGVVLLNSTIGLSALRAGKPVYCVGKSIYALPGLAASEPHQSLHEFWQDPAPPVEETLAAFLKVLKVRALVNGNFYTDDGMDLAIGNCLARFGLTAPDSVEHCAAGTVHEPVGF